MEVIGFPGYLIYDDGRVWSKPRKDTLGRPKGGRWMTQTPNSRKYLSVGLFRDGKVKMFRTNRLVAIHYIPNPDNKPEVDHIDRDVTNNHVSNLRWATSKENKDNRGPETLRKTNKTGHIGISYDKRDNLWYFRYGRKGIHIRESFKTKQEALWFKMVFLMKLKYMSR